MTAFITPALRARLGYQAGILGAIALLASAALAIGNLQTRDAIEARHAEDLQASLGQVVPAAMHENSLLGNTLQLRLGETAKPLTVYRAIHQGEVTAVAFTMTAQGYGGEIVVLLGIARDGRILGTRVLSHAETPGLGDKIEERRSPWIHGFEGRSLGDPEPARWKVKKDGGVFDQFTGATITPRAVVSAIHRGLELYRDRRDTLLYLGTAIDPEGKDS